MKKMKTLFKRTYVGQQGTTVNEVTEGSEWVSKGEGVATRKYDGTCCMVRNGLLFKRYDAKHGKVPPVGFEPAQELPDAVTGHWPGWLPISRDNPADKWHMEAFKAKLPNGTYELCGPKINGNAENLSTHKFIAHGSLLYPHCPRDFEGLKEFLTKLNIEGIVFHHPDGRMVKIRKTDFNLSRT